jgi:ketosteroid isomerase-like protein
MKPRLVAALLSAAALLNGCKPAMPGATKDDLVAADKAFSARSAKDGPKVAFKAFLSGDAKILNQYRAGEAGIQDLFLQLPDNSTLTWDPAFADVSSSGDFGYTWGRYTLTLPPFRPGARPYLQMGYYAMVWKRDAFGHWKVVFEGSNPDGKK